MHETRKGGGGGRGDAVEIGSLAVHVWVGRGCQRVTIKSAVNIGWNSKCTENEKRG